MSLCIELNNGVILKKGKNLKYVRVTSNKQEKMENFFFTCFDMIGKPFGTAFKVLDKKKLEVIDPVLVQDHPEEYECFENNNDEVTQDNRTIQDNSASQKLSKEEIMSLREEGKTGEEIVQELIDNSATFKDRTEYSKAKYLKKKKKKYLAQFIVLKPCTRLLSQMYFSKNPLKVLDIRPDTLAQLLSWSNVHANSKVLLVENCQGLLTGAVMERLATGGKVLQFYQGSSPVRIITEQFNFSLTDIENLVCSFPLDKLKVLNELLKSDMSDDEIIELVLGRNKDLITNDKDAHGTLSNVTQEINASQNNDELPSLKKSPRMETLLAKAKSPSKEISPTMENVSSMSAQTLVVEKHLLSDDKASNSIKRSHDGKMRNDRRDMHNNSRVAFTNRLQRAKECLTALRHFRENKFTSLIIASKFHPKSLVVAMIKYLTSGCPFVVYFTHQEPLMECQIVLRELNLATNMELTETFLRNTQVLPKRTHPEIVMSATGGYILRGIKVQS